MILYLHGFRSSPASYKARLMHETLQSLGQEARWHCPQLDTRPEAAMAQCMQLLDRHADPDEPLVIMGSSLGGFYATYLAEQWPTAQAIVLNPVVNAARQLAQYVGTLTNFHNHEPFEFTLADVKQLEQLAVPQITDPQRYFLLAATGDELLDWREMAKHYQGARQRIIDGSDHGLSDFADYVPEVLSFINLR